jgi:hypothetical protein
VNKKTNSSPFGRGRRGNKKREAISLLIFSQTEMLFR